MAQMEVVAVAVPEGRREIRGEEGGGVVMAPTEQMVLLGKKANQGTLHPALCVPNVQAKMEEEEFPMPSE